MMYDDASARHQCRMCKNHGDGFRALVRRSSDARPTFHLVFFARAIRLASLTATSAAPTHTAVPNASASAKMAYYVVNKTSAASGSPSNG